MRRLVIGLTALWVLAGTASMASAVTVRRLGRDTDAPAAVATPAEGSPAVDAGSDLGLAGSEPGAFDRLYALLGNDPGGSGVSPVLGGPGARPRGDDWAAELSPDCAPLLAEPLVPAGAPGFEPATRDVQAFVGGRGAVGVPGPIDEHEQLATGRSLWDMLYATDPTEGFVTLSESTLSDLATPVYGGVAAKAGFSLPTGLLLLGLIMIAPGVVGLVLYLRKHLRAMGVLPDR